MEEEKVYQTNHTKITVLVTVLILCIACSVGAVYMMIRANNIKQEQLRASDRIEQLFDSVAEVENFESESDYDKYTDKLDEVKTLMNENKLNDKYEKKLNELNLYLSDLKTLQEIEMLHYDIHNEENFIKKNELFSKLTDEKVLKKAGIFDLSEEAKNYIVAKYIYAAQNYFSREYPDCKLSKTYEYNTEDNSNTIGVIGYYNTSADIYNNMRRISKYTGVDTIRDIRSKGCLAICVEYIKDYEINKILQDERILYWYVGFEVSATLKPGGVRYNVTKYSEGKPSVSNDLSFDDLKDYYVSIQ